MSEHNDTAFLRVFGMVLGALVAFTVIIIFAANMIGGGDDESRASDPLVAKDAAARIAPVGSVRVVGQAEEEAKVAAAGAPAASQGPRSAADVYNTVCMACHMTGAAGAPKTGDKAAWEPRVGVGMDALVQTVITGKGAMPPKGGNPGLSDDEIRGAIEHILKETGLEAGTGTGTATAAVPTAAPTEPAAEPAAESDVAAAAESVMDQAADAASAVVDTVSAGASQFADDAQSAAGQVADAASSAVDSAVAAVTPEAAESSLDLEAGKGVYQKACFACHATGAAGAPKLDDAANWAPRIAQGPEVLLQSAINGKNAMPPKGGHTYLSDAEIANTVGYMVDTAQKAIDAQ